MKSVQILNDLVKFVKFNVYDHSVDIKYAITFRHNNILRSRFDHTHTMYLYCTSIIDSENINENKF